MAIYGLTTFKDIVDAVVEELKLDSQDAVEIQRIKRDINMCYINQVVPAKRWSWLAGSEQIEFKPAYYDGTVAVTPDSTTVTFSVAPTTSKTGFLFSTDQFNEVYVIESHTAGQPTATLSSPYTGALSAASAFKVWTDVVALPTDCRETIEIYHDFLRQPMEGLGMQELRRRVSLNPKLQGRPAYYSTYEYNDSESASRYRLMRIHPSIYNTSTTIKVEYTREANALELDADEPVMPIEDRIVLVYGALVRAWKRFRNPEAAEQSLRDYNEKMGLMMGRTDDSQDKPQLTPESLYLARKRGRSHLNTQRLAPSGGGSYSAPSYLKNVVIEGGSITADITVNPGITIDGVDIGTLSTDFSSHLADTEDSHDASSISVVTTGSILATNVQTALEELQGEIEAASTLTDGHIFVGDASNIPVDVPVTGDITITNTGVVNIAAGVIVDADVNAAAAIAQSKLALAITNAEVDVAAAIAQSKLALSITDTEVNAAAAIAQSKLALAITDAEVAPAAAIAQSKLALAITDAEVDPAAAIDVTKLAALNASEVVVTDASGYISTTGIAATDLNFLADTEPLTTFAMADNQAAEANVTQWAHASYDSFVIQYSLKRGASNKETGVIMIATDGSDASIAQSTTSMGTLGVTFIADVDGANVRLRYTSTSTGTAPTMKYRVQKHLA